MKISKLVVSHSHPTEGVEGENLAFPSLLNFWRKEVTIGENKKKIMSNINNKS
jgi:hypothetical protein